jgi:hypothetical protein
VLQCCTTLAPTKDQRYVFNNKTADRLSICVCFGVMYSGEYNVLDVTLSVYPHRAS